MTPGPVRLLIFFLQLGEIVIFTVILFHPNTIRLIFVIVPHVIVIVFFVVISLILGTQHCRS